MRTWSEISKTIHDFDIDEDVNVYTVSEFAQRIGISEQKVRRLMKNEIVKAKEYKYNNRTYKYFTEDQYQDFLKSDVYLNLPKVKNSDLLDTYHGKLHVISFSDAAIHKGYYGSYVCECKCGNTIEVPRVDLLSGKAQSCGCKYHDLTGQTFGYWHVDSLADFSYTPGNSKLFRYNCTCRCGTKRVIIARSLTSGASWSCGCFREDVAMSKYELCVREYLDQCGFIRDANIKKYYNVHKTYEDLLGLGGNRLSYDFYVNDGKNDWLIECQGGQHYFAVDLWGGDAVFQKQVEHDNRKRTYACKIGIKLIEIPYTMLNKDDICVFLKKEGIY